MLTLSAVNRLKTIVSLLLAAVWLPASSHAWLERFELIHQVHADHDQDSDGSHEHDADSDGSHEHDAQNHEAADGNCTLSPTHVNVPQPDTVAMPLLFCALAMDWTSELHAELPPSGLAPPGTAPPQLSPRWQFAFRTALPVRAPSLIS